MTIAVLAVMAKAVNDFITNLHYPRAPDKLAWNVAAAVLTILALATELVVQHLQPVWWTSLSNRSTLLTHLGAAVLLVIIWVVATATAWWNCADLCQPRRASDGFVQYAGMCCDCGSQQYIDCGQLDEELDDGFLSAYISPQTATYKAAQALDILLMLSFITFAGIVFLRYRKRGDQRHIQPFAMELPTEGKTDVIDRVQTSSYKVDGNGTSK